MLVEQVGLGQRDEVGARQLLADESPYVFVLRALADGFGISGDHDGVQPEAGPVAHRHGDAGGIGDAAGLEQDMVWWLRQGGDRVQRGPEVIADGAADAAVGEFDHGRVGGLDQPGVDVHRAEVVHQNGEAQRAGLGQPPVDDGGLAGAEVAREDRDRDARGHEAMGKGVPSNTVPQIGMSRRAVGSTAKGSCSSTVKSAFLPARIEPTSSSMPRI